MRKFVVGVGRALGLLVAVGAAAACAGDIGKIDRVQPAYVNKADFANTSWYYRRTVVDAPESMAPWATIGTGDLFTIERVRWEIQEDFLIAYRDYEYVLDSEEQRLDGSDYQGTPVAAFPILRHFDIVDEYDASTGETTNVVSENVNDRPWYERSYMRVAWWLNANPKLDFILPIDQIDTDNMGGGPSIIHEDEATHPMRARLEPEKGYFDFVSNHYAQPDIETCYYTFGMTNCGAGELQVRHAFMKVDESRNAGYKPLYYPDSVPVRDEQGNEITDPETGEVKREEIFNRFGFYRLERLTYDDQRTLTQSGRLDRILRFDLWQRSVDEAGNEIPVVQRQLRPIEYYLNWDFPEDLVDTAREVEDSWNEVFTNTVESMRGEPLPVDANGNKPAAFILHRNSCNVANLTNVLNSRGLWDEVGALMNSSERDLSTVGRHLVNWCATTEYVTRDSDNPFIWQQNGDPRFNMMYWIPDIVPSAFSGYGPMLADPISGRIVVSSAYVLGWTIDNAATRALEYIDYINGVWTEGDLREGRNLPPGYSHTDNDPRSRMFANEDIRTRADHHASHEHLASLEGRFARFTEGRPEGDAALMVPLENSAHFEERLARVAGTSLERDWLLRNEDLMLAGRGDWLPGMAPTDDLYKRASVVDRSRTMQQRDEKVARYMQERTFCPMADLDSALVGLAERLKDKTREERRQFLRKAIFKAVMLHEVGHNVGLRHNFEASYDALNYFPDFWRIEADNVEMADKLAESQPEYMYSSIMDYHGRVNGDFRGLGRYDNAAIKFGYGQMIETFPAETGEGGKALRDWLFVNDYKKVGTKMGDWQALYNREDVKFDWTKAGIKQSEVEAITAREVPYRFCSDEFAGQTPTCRRFDFGANQRETFQASYVRYKNYFVFTNYLRNRLKLDFGRVAGRAYSTFRDVVTTYQYMYLYRSMQEKLFGSTPFFETDLGADMAAAVADGLNMMGEVIAFPTPDDYVRCVATNGQEVYFPDNMIEFDAVDDAGLGKGPTGEVCHMADERYLGLGDAFPLFLGFSDDMVEWDFTYLGTYWDKVTALQELADPTARFFRVNQAEDLRAYSVSPYRIYDQEILDIVGSLITYDRAKLGNYLDVEQDRVLPRTVVDSSVSLDLPGGAPSRNAMPKVVPALARNLQRMGVLYGVALMTSPLDTSLDFSKYTRVTLKGAADDIATSFDQAGDREVAECTLPAGGATYRALATRDGNHVGFGLIKECSAQVATLGANRAKLAQARTEVSRREQALEDAKATLEAVEADADATEEVKAEALAAATAAEEALQTARTEAPRLIAEAEEKVEDARYDLASAEQMLQYTRLIHLVYEHGVDL